MRSCKTIDIRNAVINLDFVDEDGFATIDSENIFRKYSFETFERESGFKSNVGKLQAYSHKSAIDPVGRGVLFYKEATKELFYFDRVAKKYKYSMKPHNSSLEYICFSPDGKYFLTGGHEGRVYFFDSLKGDKVDIFSPHSDSITALAISADGRWVATAGYDKIIKVTNRSFRGEPYRLISHKAVPTKIQFLSQQRLLSTDRDGTILIWDTIKTKVIYRLESFKAEISTFTLTKDERYLFVGGIRGEVALYDLKKHQLVKRNFIKVLSGINTILYHAAKQLLLLGLSNGQIVIHDLRAEERKFREFLEKKDYKACYDMCSDNPLLYEVPEFQELEKVFEVYYEKTRKLLEAEKKLDAQKLIAVFTNVVQKRLLVQKLFNDFSAYAQFKLSFQKKKFAPAYALAEQYEGLKDTKEYIYMEKLWRKTIIAVQSLINDKDYESKMRALFRPFQGVPGKNLVVHSLLENRHVFAIFLSSIKKKEYHTAFNLVDNHSFLKDMPEYDKLLLMGKAYEDNTIMSFNSGKYHDAVKFCEIVTFFPGKRDFASDLRSRANIYAEAMQYYAEKSMSRVYDMIKKYPYLEDATIAKELEKSFLQAVRSSNIYAKKGDVKSIKKLLKPFFKVRSKREAIIHVITQAYVVQISFYMKKKDLCSLKSALDSYRTKFGVTTYLEDFVFIYKEHYTFDFKVSEGRREYNASIELLPDTLV